MLRFNVIPYSVEDLNLKNHKEQFHNGELVKRLQTYVRMDMQRLGVQGIDCWGYMPLIRYQIPFKNYSYIKPIK